MAAPPRALRGDLSSTRTRTPRLATAASPLATVPTNRINAPTPVVDDDGVAAAMPAEEPFRRRRAPVDVDASATLLLDTTLTALMRDSPAPTTKVAATTATHRAPLRRKGAPRARSGLRASSLRRERALSPQSGMTAVGATVEAPTTEAEADRPSAAWMCEDQEVLEQLAIEAMEQEQRLERRKRASSRRADPSTSDAAAAPAAAAAAGTSSSSSSKLARAPELTKPDDDARDAEQRIETAIDLGRIATRSPRRKRTSVAVVAPKVAPPTPPSQTPPRRPPATSAPESRMPPPPPPPSAQDVAKTSATTTAPTKRRAADASPSKLPRATTGGKARAVEVDGRMLGGGTLAFPTEKSGSSNTITTTTTKATTATAHAVRFASPSKLPRGRRTAAVATTTAPAAATATTPAAAAPAPAPLSVVVQLDQMAAHGTDAPVDRAAVELGRQERAQDRARGERRGRAAEAARVTDVVARKGATETSLSTPPSHPQGPQSLAEDAQATATAVEPMSVGEGRAEGVPRRADLVAPPPSLSPPLHRTDGRGTTVVRPRREEPGMSEGTTRLTVSAPRRRSQRLSSRRTSDVHGAETQVAATVGRKGSAEAHTGDEAAGEGCVEETVEAGGVGPSVGPEEGEAEEQQPPPTRTLAPLSVGCPTVRKAKALAAATSTLKLTLPRSPMARRRRDDAVRLAARKATAQGNKTASETRPSTARPMRALKGDTAAVQSGGKARTSRAATGARVATAAAAAAAAAEAEAPRGYRVTSTGSLVRAAEPATFSFASRCAPAIMSTKPTAPAARAGVPKANPVPAWLVRRKEELQREEEARLEARLEAMRQEELARERIRRRRDGLLADEGDEVRGDGDDDDDDDDDDLARGRSDGARDVAASAKRRRRGRHGESAANPTAAAAPTSHIEARLARRAEWESRRAEHEARLEAEREALRLAREERERVEEAERRKRSVVRAKPVPRHIYYPNHPRAPGEGRQTDVAEAESGGGRRVPGGGGGPGVATRARSGRRHAE